MLIRPARPDDLAQWRPLWQGYQAFYHADLPEQTTTRTWQRFHAPDEPMHCAVADKSGFVQYRKLVG